jgi:hypothetical protein
VRHCPSIFGFRRGQSRYRTTSTATITSGINSGCAAKRPPVSSDGDPFETVRGRKIATQITITTLTAVKNSDHRRGPRLGGVSAFIAVPPCDAAQAVLKRSPLLG